MIDAVNLPGSTSALSEIILQHGLSDLLAKRRL